MLLRICLVALCWLGQVSMLGVQPLDVLGAGSSWHSDTIGCPRGCSCSARCLSGSSYFVAWRLAAPALFCAQSLGRFPCHCAWLLSCLAGPALGSPAAMAGLGRSPSGGSSARPCARRCLALSATLGLNQPPWRSAAPICHTGLDTLRQSTTLALSRSHPRTLGFPGAHIHATLSPMHALIIPVLMQ